MARLWSVTDKKMIFFAVALVALVVGAVIAIFAIDKAKADFARDLARVRLDEGAEVQLPNPNLESARDALVIMASVTSVVVFLAYFLPFAWEGSTT